MLEAGEVLAGKYVLRECIGVGGMGTVFLADHPTLVRRIAIKSLHRHFASDPKYLRRFHNEAVAASRVRHRGCVKIIDFDVARNGAPFIAMEIVPGRPLGQILGENLVPLRRSLEIIDQLLEVLDAAHTCSVVHSDVKSDNVMIEQQAGGDVVTLIDFGLAHLDGASEEPGLVLGTPEYVAPELLRGAPPAPASDLYAVGVILYELVTGATPFSVGATSEVLRRQLEEAVVPPSSRRPDRGIPEDIDRITLRALDKDPRARFASAQEFRAALRAVSQRRELSPRPRCRGTPPIGVAVPAPRHVAHGSDVDRAGRDALRRAIAQALVRGDLPEIARGYAALADELVRDRNLRAAICELEEGIDVVTAGRSSADASSEPVGRLVATLATLYELAGEPRKARRFLASADGRGGLVEGGRDV